MTALAWTVGPGQILAGVDSQICAPINKLEVGVEKATDASPSDVCQSIESLN
jgi:hypothetical protein